MNSPFLELLIKISPLYLFIVFGYLAGRFFNIKRESLASLLIYLIAPLVVFHGILSRPFSIDFLIVPLLLFVMASLIGISVYLLSKNLWMDNTPNLLAFAGGTGNTGYFGLPVVTMLLGTDAYPIAVMAVMSTIIFEVTVGYYFTARSHYTAKESFIKIIRLPAIYTFILALTLSIFNVSLHPVLNEFLLNFKSTYTVLGMMMIGLALATVKFRDIDLKFVLISQVARFIVWPIAMYLVLLLDSSTIGFLSPLTKKTLFLISFLPMAANTVVFATELKVMPEKAATAVFISTTLALFILPFVGHLADLLIR